MRRSASRKTLFVVALASVLLVACATAPSAEERSPGERPLVIAPYVEGQDFCDATVSDSAVVTADEAAQACSARRETAADRIIRELNALGPVVSPSKHYELGYTLDVPLFRYVDLIDGQWKIRTAALRASLAVITRVNRPVVVYLSSNHFIDSAWPVAKQLAKDPVNLMWNTSGPLEPSEYLSEPLVDWTLNLSAPVNVLRAEAFRSAVRAICQLPRLARNRVVAITVLGEADEMFPNFTDGPSFGIPYTAASDYSPGAVAGFDSWLAQRFRSVQALNRYLQAAFRAFSAVRPPSADFTGTGTNTLSHEKVLAQVGNSTSGNIPIYGWAYDTQGRPLNVEVIVDGKIVGGVKLGLNRTDVTDALPIVPTPDVGFRLNLDFRRLWPGRHSLEVKVKPSDGRATVLATQTFVVEGPTGASTERAVVIPADKSATGPSGGGDIIGHLDGPSPGEVALYNPLSALWLQYQNDSVRQYIQYFSSLTSGSCVPESKVFSDQITPELNGSWNGDLLAVDASKENDPFYQQGTTLYGGAAYGEALIQMKTQLHWRQYAVTELNPDLPLSPSQYSAMFDMYRRSGAVFVAPYYLSIVPARLTLAGGLQRFQIAAHDNSYGAGLFWSAIRRIMRQ